MTSPMMTFQPLLSVSSPVVLDVAIPAIQGSLLWETIWGSTVRAVGTGGGESAKKIPAITLTASCSSGSVASLSKKIPAIRLTASALQQGVYTLSVAIPAVKLSAAMSQGYLATLDKDIPAIRLTSHVLVGNVMTLSKAIGAIDLTASSYWTLPATLSVSIPDIRLLGRVRGTITTIAFNPKVLGITSYSSFDYNSMCVFGGKVLLAKADGVYEHSGDTDNGTVIDWKIRPGLLDFKGNRPDFVVLSGKATGDVVVVAEDPDGERYEYIGEAVSETEGEIRVKLGKGIKQRYMGLEINNGGNVVGLAVDGINIFGTPTGKKR
jgi:hypothetical protein